MITQMSRLALITAISLGFIMKTTPANARSRTITCESNDDRYTFCGVNTSGGVRLTRQLSSSSCRQGRSWGYEKDGIWVDDGCRAEFEVRGKKKSNDDTAAIVGGALAVGAIAAIIAASSDDNDDNDRNSQKSSRQSLTCSSEDDRYTECGINGRPRQVILKRQLSHTGCWEGDTWGYENNVIWVDNGCRAEFEIKR